MRGVVPDPGTIRIEDHLHAPATDREVVETAALPSSSIRAHARSDKSVLPGLDQSSPGQRDVDGVPGPMVAHAPVDREPRVVRAGADCQRRAVKPSDLPGEVDDLRVQLRAGPVRACGNRYAPQAKTARRGPPAAVGAWDTDRRSRA